LPSQKLYVGSAIIWKGLIKNSDTGARVEAGTLPTISFKLEGVANPLVGTASWITGNTGDLPSLKVLFTPNAAGEWELIVKPVTPFTGEEHFHFRVE
jgi:hypothetical protein